jgi:hypothetical protein
MSFLKDPDETLDYEIKWDNELATDSPADTIVASTWVVPSGITKTSDDFTDLKTIIWLTGGTSGQNYHLTNRITTLIGRVIDQSVTVKVRDK